LGMLVDFSTAHAHTQDHHASTTTDPALTHQNCYRC
jgi:hypothetical protein